ncbi:DUF488 family protein [Maridesulfovibrio sp.]|uniref:DUF488 domain-containing protein n=1 Tax=Maridesulfovibrio sp. TaxID=2795000 RepID=UPI002A187FDA|nr:DUF488 family protein [Maridesulfovibrio sp.]
MTMYVVRLGTTRIDDEGIRIGAVRRPPRGVKKEEYASQNWYDIWLPEIAPSPELMKLGKSVKSEAEWAKFSGKYKKELSSPDKNRILDLLAVFSHTTNFSIGCYCEDESRCHRSTLRDLLIDKGAKVRLDIHIYQYHEDND